MIQDVEKIAKLLMNLSLGNAVSTATRFLCDTSVVPEFACTADTVDPLEM